MWNIFGVKLNYIVILEKLCNSPPLLIELYLWPYVTVVLYHIYKLINILLFGFIMMFDTGMFLLSLDTDYIAIALLKTPGLMPCKVQSDVLLDLAST